VILYLDINGVLNGDAEYRKLGLILKRTGRSFLGGETQISKEEMLLLLNPEKISLLNSLPSEIILSSTWRQGLNQRTIRALKALF